MFLYNLYGKMHFSKLMIGINRNIRIAELGQYNFHYILKLIISSTQCKRFCQDLEVLLKASTLQCQRKVCIIFILIFRCLIINFIGLLSFYSILLFTNFYKLAGVLMASRVFHQTTICQRHNYTGKNFVPPLNRRTPLW